jgi:hypothetical protein
MDVIYLKPNAKKFFPLSPVTPTRGLGSLNPPQIKEEEEVSGPCVDALTMKIHAGPQFNNYSVILTTTTIYLP